MKKINFIFIITLILIVLLSSNAFAATTNTAKRQAFEKAIVEYAASMNDRGYRFAYEEDDALLLELAYTHDRTVYNANENDTYLYFNVATFISYTYNRVLGLKMHSGDTPYGADKIYKMIAPEQKTDPDYFETIIDDDGSFIGIGATDAAFSNPDVRRKLRPGDIFVEAYKEGGSYRYDKIGMWAGDINGDGELYVILMTEDGRVACKSYKTLGDIEFDVARISDSRLNNLDINYCNDLACMVCSGDGTTCHFDYKAINYWATGIVDELDNLKLNIGVNNSGNFVFLDNNGSEISQGKVAKAIRIGYLSQYGDLKKLDDNYDIKFELMYNPTNSTLPSDFIIGDDGSMTNDKGTFISKENENYTKFKKSLVLFDGDRIFGKVDKNAAQSSSGKVPINNRFNLEEYKRKGYIYPAYNYFNQSEQCSSTNPHHSLYVGVFIKNGAIGNKEELLHVYPLMNNIGMETIEDDGTHVVPAFAEGLASDGKPLQEYIDADIQPPEGLYELNFTNVGDTVEIEKDATTGKYKNNGNNEIIFKVNKSGTYAIKLETGAGKTIEEMTLLLGQPASNSGTTPKVIGYKEADNFTPKPLMYAGFKSEGTCRAGDCKYKNYRRGEYLEENPKISYPLLSNNIYVINANRILKKAGSWGKDHEYYSSLETDFSKISVTFVKEMEQTSDGVNVIYELYDHDSQGLYSQANLTIEQLHINGDAIYQFFEGVEAMLAYILRNLANALVLMINSALSWVENTGAQEIISIDAIVFDRYPYTKLSLFTSDSNGDVSTFIGKFAENVNVWYRNLMLIAILGYLAILLYLGIRVTLSSTGANKALFKEGFVQWVSGVVILFIFPIVIKYAIQINSTFVQMIEQLIVHKDDGSVELDDSSATTEYEEGLVLSPVQEMIEKLTNNPFPQSDKGYMAIMSRRAHNTERLSFAFAYLIMAFQLMIIAMMYYKRLFMVVFLIVLFPIVMLVHVLEKVGNIKIGNAFSKWNREILLAIFIQSIHAIIYSFSIATVVAAGDSNNDWILMLVGVTFLFNGEEIMKKILGQSGEATKSLAQNAAEAMKTGALVSAGYNAVKGNVSGVVGGVKELMHYKRESDRYDKLSKMTDEYGETPARGAIPPATDLPHFNNLYNECGDTNAINLGNAIQTVNNLEHADPAQLFSAMQTIEKAKKDGKYKDLLGDLDEKKYNKFKGIVDETSKDIASGKKDKKKIDMELTMKLQREFPAMDMDVMKKMVYGYMKNPLVKTKANNQATDRSKIKGEMKNARKKIADVRKIKFASKPNRAALKALDDEAMELCESLYGTNYPTGEQRKIALSAVMVKNALNGKGDYTADQLMKSMEILHEAQAKSVDDVKDELKIKSIQNFINKGRGEKGRITINELRYAMADHVKREACGNLYRVNGSTTIGPGKEHLRDAAKKADHIIAELKDGGEVDDIEEYSEVSVSQMLNQEARVQKKAQEMSEPGKTVDISAIERAFDVDFARKTEGERQTQNTDAQSKIMQFATEMERITEPKKRIDGMTKEELQLNAQAAKKNLKKTAVRTVAKTVTSTASMTVGGFVGTAVGIGLTSEDSIVEEAMQGVAAGAAIGAAVSGSYDATPQNKMTKKVKVKNPYTGEMEEVDITFYGDEFTDDVLKDKGMKEKIKEQFYNRKMEADRMHAEQTRMNQEEAQRARQELADSYKRAMEEINRRNGGNP